MSINMWLYLAIGLGVVSLGYALSLYAWVNRQNVGGDREQAIAGYIQKGARAYLAKLYGTLAVLVAVLGVAILNVTPLPDGSTYNFLWATLNGFLSGVGFTFVLLAMAGIRERLELVDMPKSMRGFASGLILAGTMALAFYGFMGLKI